MCKFKVLLMLVWMRARLVASRYKKKHALFLRHPVLPHVPWLIPLFYKPDYGPVGSKHVAQLLVA